MFWHILNIVDKGLVGQDVRVLVDPVHRILEGQLCLGVLKKKETTKKETEKEKRGRYTARKTCWAECPGSY